MSRAKSNVADAKEPTNTADAGQPAVTEATAAPEAAPMPVVTEAPTAPATSSPEAAPEVAPQPPATTSAERDLMGELPAFPRVVSLVNNTARDFAPGGKFVEKYQTIEVLVKDADEITRLATDCRSLIDLDENYRDLDPSPLRIEA